MSRWLYVGSLLGIGSKMGSPDRPNSLTNNPLSLRVPLVIFAE